MQNILTILSVIFSIVRNMYKLPYISQNFSQVNGNTKGIVKILQHLFPVLWRGKKLLAANSQNNAYANVF